MAGQISRTPSHDSPDGTKTSAAWHWRPTLSGPELHEAVKRHFRVEPVANALNWRTIPHESVVENFKAFFLHTAELGVRLSLPQTQKALKHQFSSDVRVLHEFARTLCDAQRECWQRTKSTTTGARTSKAVLEVIEAHRKSMGAYQEASRTSSHKAVPPWSLMHLKFDIVLKWYTFIGGLLLGLFVWGLTVKWGV